jgi:hypothetical protein
MPAGALLQRAFAGADVPSLPTIAALNCCPLPRIGLPDGGEMTSE